MSADISPEAVDRFLKFHWCFESETGSGKLVKNSFWNFCLGEFYFQFEFFYYFDFQVRKTHSPGSKL